MVENRDPTNLQQLLDRLSEAANDDPVSVGSVLGVLGRRSFGALLLVAGLITLAPLVGDIPGVPTVVAVFVFMLAVQLLLGWRHFWLPRWLLVRSVPNDKFAKALGWMRPVARFIDRLLRPRLRVLVGDTATYPIAVLCILIALVMPALELIPFSANAAGAALTAFGLALIARDGMLAVAAFALTALTIGLIAYNLV